MGDVGFSMASVGTAWTYARRRWRCQQQHFWQHRLAAVGGVAVTLQARAVVALAEAVTWAGIAAPSKLKQIPKEKMFDQSGQWIHLETFDDFDNGLSELIDLWSSKATKAVKESALAHFKEDLAGAVLNWADNRARSKKYAAIGKELAEFEEALR